MKLFRILSACTILGFQTVSFAQGLPILGAKGQGLSALEVKVVADSQAGLHEPADLAINPLHPEQIYVTNHSRNSVAVLELNAEGAVAKASLASGMGSDHFMPRPSGIAFASNGFFATIHDIATKTQDSTPADFMGPTLWTQEWFEGGHGSHMDMLHNSPSGLGIAWIHGNAYVVNDGAHGSLTVYDFRRDHNYGGADHSDGIALRYADGQLLRVKGVPSGVVFDQSTGVAYAVDTGHRRLVSVDLGLKLATTNNFDYILMANSTYKVEREVEPNYDGGLQAYVDGAALATVVDGQSMGMEQPSGLALRDGVLYVADHAQPQILAFDLKGQLLDRLLLSDVLPEAAGAALGGLEFDAEGRLYVTDMKNDKLYRLELKR